MPVAIDTSILIAAERAGGIADLLPADEEGPYYIPAHAAAEFLAGTHSPAPRALQEKALRIYLGTFRDLVRPFGEREAAALAELSASLRKTGQTMKWFDAAIAAQAIASGDKILSLDSDFDRVKDRVAVIP